MCTSYGNLTTNKKLFYLAPLFMQPDYSFKYFNDKRSAYVHLLMALAADSAC